MSDYSTSCYDYSASCYDYSTSCYDYSASRYWLLLVFIITIVYLGVVCISYTLVIQCNAVCRRPIEERVVHALGKAWHVEVRQRGVV